MNRTIVATFGRTWPATYTQGILTPLCVTFVLDNPNLQEGASNPSHLRAFASADQFGSIVPMPGDAVLLDGAVNYKVYEVRRDEGMGVHLVMHRS